MGLATRFGAYEILHELQAGGMGSVLLGRRRGPGSFEQLVAIKTIRPEFASAEAIRAMFLDEAAILARLNHPNIATVHDFGEEAGSLYMVMEYVAGTSFRALWDLPLPPGVAARAIAEACRGVHAAHEVRDTSGALLGVVHRDISPENLMLGFDGHVKVIDFGIALVKNRQAPVTLFGTVKGKPPYMSPEQVKNEAIDRRSDVFSLAIVLHELVTRKPLFDGDSIYAIARAVEHMEIPRPSTVIGKQLPIGLDDAVMNALERDVARRTPTAAALAEQLEYAIAASGDDTLEAWSERELAGLRDRHRAWIARVVTGESPTNQPPRRSSGAITVPGAIVPIAVVSPPAEPAVVEPAARRRPAALVFAILAVLAIGGSVLYLARETATVAPQPRDATAARFELDAVPLDVAELDAAIAIAADGQHADARRVVVDAANRPPRPSDAASVVTVDAAIALAVGTGKLIVRHHPASRSYLDVQIDGATFGRTPIINARPIPAGKHVLTLVTPDTNEVVYRRSIVVVDGETLAIDQPTPH